MTPEELSNLKLTSIILASSDSSFDMNPLQVYEYLCYALRNLIIYEEYEICELVKNYLLTPVMVNIGENYESYRHLFDSLENQNN